MADREIEVDCLSRALDLLSDLGVTPYFIQKQADIVTVVRLVLCIFDETRPAENVAEKENALLIVYVFN